MTDTAFYTLADSAVSGRKDLEAAGTRDYETATQHEVLVRAMLAETSSAAGGVAYFLFRELVSDVNELPYRIANPPPINLQYDNSLAAQTAHRDYSTGVFGDAEGNFWWLSYDTSALPSAMVLAVSQGTGALAKEMDFTAPAVAANPAADRQVEIPLRAEQPLGSIHATAIQEVNILRYAPAALHFGYPRVIPIVGSTATGPDSSTHDLASFYQNHDNRPVLADFGGSPTHRNSHWSYSISYRSDGTPQLVCSRDPNPGGLPYADEGGDIVGVRIRTNDNGDESSGTLTFSVVWYGQ